MVGTGYRVIATWACLLINNYIKEIIMRSTFSRMAVVALTLWLGFAAGAANATTTFSVWTGSDIAGWTASFGNTSVGNAFNDLIAFSLPGLSSTGSAIVSSNTVRVGHISIANVSLNLFDLLSSGVIVASATGAPSNTLNFVFGPGPVPGNYDLNIAGVKINHSLPGGYNGIITIDPILPVPEPKTYAMLLAGLGLVGFSARRRMNNNA
jgi:PEP-CTERM motif